MDLGLFRNTTHFEKDVLELDFELVLICWIANRNRNQQSSLLASWRGDHFPDGLKIPDDMLEVVTEHPSSGNCSGASQFHVREALSIRSGSLPLPIRVNPAVFCYAEHREQNSMRRRLVASIGKDVSISVIHGQPFDFVRRQTGRVANVDPLG